MAETVSINKNEISSKRRRKRREKENITDVNGENEDQREVRLSSAEVVKDDEGNNNERKRRRNRKPKQPATTELTLTVCENEHSIDKHVAQLQEDIIPSNERPESSSNHSIWHTNATSYSHGKLFMEFQRGVFKAIEKNKLEKLELEESTKNNENIMKQDPILQCVLLGLQLYKSLQKFANCIQGMFAGFAMCYLIVVYSLGSQAFNVKDWLAHYAALSSPIEAIFYIFCAICLWTLLARCGIGGGDFNMCEQVRNRNAALLAIIFYFLTLILTLSMARFSSRHNIWHLKTDFAIEKVFEEEMIWWSHVNLCRCISAILGWLVLSATTSKDYNGKFLQKLHDNFHPILHLKTESV
ncbi:hypothetical protein CHUAL_001047 [Chamberlinius hualienensis]